MGRFISPDPVFRQEVPQSLNPYAYGLNNPAAFADPSGLDACDTPDCGEGPVTAPSAKDKVKDKKKAKKAAKIVPKGGGPSQQGTRTLPEATVDAMNKAAHDLLNGEWSGRGICGSVSGPSFFPKIGGEHDGCFLATEENIGTVQSFSDIAVTSPGWAAAVSVMSTNATNVKDISGWGVCAGGGAYSLSTTVCASLNPDDLSPTGVFVVLPGVATSGGAWVSFGWTRTTEIMRTPAPVRKLLEHNARGTSFILRFWACQNDISCGLGALDDFLNPNESVEMAPGPMPGEPGFEDSGGELA
ncbi:hypothetical protein [Nonomuraea insulae]|uniref:RHS repeat-associated protein n=1 Tax=Nonomuraea insulae TaxID=1616787 RepID=A0ABW1CDJ0_9ACTN